MIDWEFGTQPKVPVSGADDGVLGALVRLLCDALAVHRQDEVTGNQAAPLRHRLGVDLRQMNFHQPSSRICG